MVFHVSDVGLKSKPDSLIWEYAKQNSFTIVSLDMDFYNLSILKGFPPKVILLKVGNRTTAYLADLILRMEKNILEFLNSKDFDSISCLVITNSE